MLVERSGMCVSVLMSVFAVLANKRVHNPKPNHNNPNSSHTNPNPVVKF